MSGVFVLGDTTPMWTEGGLRSAGELYGDRSRVMVHGGNGTVFVPATITPLGRQPSVELTMGRRNLKRLVVGSAQPLEVPVRICEMRSESRPVLVPDLQLGGRLLTVRPRSRLTKIVPSPFGIAAGIVFGDGHRPTRRDSAEVTLYGRKRELTRYFTGCQMRHSENAITIYGLPGSFKDPIALNEGASALYGWLAGYLATDGTISARGQVSLSSARWEHVDAARTVAIRLGIGTGDITTVSRIGIHAQHPTDLFTVRLMAPPKQLLLREPHRSRWRTSTSPIPSWTVREITPESERCLYRVDVEGAGGLVLDGFVVATQANTSAGS